MLLCCRVFSPTTDLFNTGCYSLLRAACWLNSVPRSQVAVVLNITIPPFPCLITLCVWLPHTTHTLPPTIIIKTYLPQQRILLFVLLLRITSIQRWDIHYCVYLPLVTLLDPSYHCMPHVLLPLCSGVTVACSFGTDIPTTTGGSSALPYSRWYTTPPPCPLPSSTFCYRVTLRLCTCWLPIPSQPSVHLYTT